MQNARIGGEVPSHQDSTFLYNEPMKLVGFWLALQDCTPTNGSMEYIPASHKGVPTAIAHLSKT